MQKEIENFQITIDMLMDKSEQSRIGINPCDVQHTRDFNQILYRILENYDILKKENKQLTEQIEKLKDAYIEGRSHQAVLEVRARDKFITLIKNELCKKCLGSVKQVLISE